MIKKRSTIDIHTIKPDLTIISLPENLGNWNYFSKKKMTEITETFIIFEEWKITTVLTCITEKQQHNGCGSLYK